MIIIEVKWGDDVWRPVSQRGVYADDHVDRAREAVVRLKSSYEHAYRSPAPDYRLVYCRRVAVLKEVKT